MAHAGIQYQIGINSTQAQVAIQRLRGAFSGLGGLATKVLAPLGAGLSVAGFAAGIKGALDLGGRLSDLAAQTGTTAGKLMVLQQAFRDNGIAAENIGLSLSTMQANLARAADGSKEIVEALAAMGLSMSDLSGKDAADQFQTIGKAIAKVEDPAKRALLSMQLFGRSGKELQTLFADSGALEGAAAAIGKQAELMDRNASLFDRVSDLLAQSGLKVQGFFVGVADRVAPVLLPLLEGFQKIDLAGLGQQIGDIISFLIASISSGEFLNIIGSSLILAFQNGVNFLWSALQGVAAAAVESFAQAGQTMALVLGIVTKPQFWEGIGKTLLGAAQSFGATMSYALADILAALRDIPGIRDLIGDDVLDSTISMGDRLNAEGNKNKVEGVDMVTPFVDQYLQQARDALAAVGDAFQQGMEDAPLLFDTSIMEQVLADSLAAVNATIVAAETAAEKLRTTTKDAKEKDTTEPPTAGGYSPKADRLAQIGGFVGGGAAGGNRGIEANTEKTAKAAENTANGMRELSLQSGRHIDVTIGMASQIARIPPLLEKLQPATSGKF